MEKECKDLSIWAVSDLSLKDLETLINDYFYFGVTNSFCCKHVLYSSRFSNMAGRQQLLILMWYSGILEHDGYMLTWELELRFSSSMTHVTHHPLPENLWNPPTPPPPVNPPVRVLLQALDGLLDIADVPELDLTVISTAGQVVLAVGVEVQVTDQLAMGVLYTVDLTGEKRRRDRSD